MPQFKSVLASAVALAAVLSLSACNRTDNTTPTPSNTSPSGTSPAPSGAASGSGG